MPERPKMLRRLATAFLALVALLVITAAAGVWLTGGEYPPPSLRSHAVAAPAPYQPPAGAPERSPAVRTVVVLLFDGLAPAMLEGQPTPTLDRLRREGSW